MPKRRGPRHPGVTLLKPDPARRIGHRARYVDPDSGRTVKESLDPALRTLELREEWAVRKSMALAKRRLELEGGAHRATGTALEDAIKTYYDDHPQLRDKTLEAYKGATKKFLAWATKVGLKSADDVTGPRLVAWKAEVVKEPKLARAKGKKRGSQQATTEPRSPYTINRELRSVGTVLQYLRRLGLLPRITSDDLADGLRLLTTTKERIDYRKPHELQKLLDAALRHDAECFAATREELAGLRPVGSTARYQPIAPFCACAILTGMRFGEIVDLDWKHVDLEALDHDGKPVGEIHLSGATKTKAARTVGLEVSPLLRKMLAAMKLRNGKGSVFGLTRETAEAARRRLVLEYGAPASCGWQALRRTCGTYLTNSPGIFGASSAYMSARQLGHSVQVAEKHYLGLIRGLPRDARVLEDAMQLSAELERVITSVGARPAARGAKTA